VIDTPGFGDYVNNYNCWVPVVDYIDAQYGAYFNNEMQANRENFIDPRIHACLYFIEPTGHSLKTLDIVAMKNIGARVNLIPVIARADTITKKELKAFKGRIQEEIQTHEIPIYRPPLESEDGETTKQNQELHDAIPFAVIGSESFVGVDDKKGRARQYLWGVAEVENDNHNDFKKLRRLLLRSHLLDIIVNTDNHYEDFRNKQLERGGLVDGMTPEKMLKDLEISTKKKQAQIDEKYKTKINQEDARIKELSAKLDKSKDELNSDLESKKQALDALKEEVRVLQEKLASPKKK
jgi:cell division control protein 12